MRVIRWVAVEFGAGSDGPPRSNFCTSLGRRSRCCVSRQISRDFSARMTVTTLRQGNKTGRSRTEVRVRGRSETYGCRRYSGINTGMLDYKKNPVLIIGMLVVPKEPCRMHPSSEGWKEILPSPPNLALCPFTKKKNLCELQIFLHW